MLNSIVTWALNMRVLVVAAALALLVVGINATRNAPLDVFPEFAPPLVEVQMEAPGLSTEEVDSLVTVPLENSLNGLPAVVKPPVLMSPYSSLSRVLKVGQTLSQMELSELSRWTIRPRLMSVRGVANVAIWGQRDKQYQVLVDPQHLRAAGVTLNAITKAAGDAVVISAGGFIDTPNQRLSVAQLALIVTPEDLARTVVEFRNGAPIRLGDVAEVKTGNPAPIGDGVINDGTGILLIVEKQPWGNTLDVTQGVEKMLEELKPALPGVEVDSTIFRPATFIQLSMDHLTDALWLGCLLVVVVLALFLGDWRTTLISLTAIPLSLAIALLFLAWRVKLSTP